MGEAKTVEGVGISMGRGAVGEGAIDLGVAILWTLGVRSAFMRLARCVMAGEGWGTSDSVGGSNVGERGKESREAGTGEGPGGPAESREKGMKPGGLMEPGWINQGLGMGSLR